MKNNYFVLPDSEKIASCLVTFLNENGQIANEVRVTCHDNITRDLIALEEDIFLWLFTESSASFDIFVGSDVSAPKRFAPEDYLRLAALDIFDDPTKRKCLVARCFHYMGNISPFLLSDAVNRNREALRAPDRPEPAEDGATGESAVRAGRSARAGAKRRRPVRK